MKGAVLLTSDAEVLAKLARLLPGVSQDEWLGCDVERITADEMTLVERGSGHRLLMYPAFGNGLEWEYRNPPHVPVPGVPLPPMDSILGYNVDCRWEDLFARVVREVAEFSGEAAWVLDQSNHVWDARNVDPECVRL